MTPCIWFWIAAIVIFIIAEAVTVALVSVWFIGGAVCALLAAIFGAPGLAQAAVFVIVSALLLILVCPLAKKKLKPKPERLNADRLAGQTAIVTEPIDAQLDTGAVKVSGVLWTAKCPSCARIETGAHVKILRVEGAKLLVEPVEVPVNIR